ncbi:MAG: M14 family metallopeptidase [Chloroflexota bacterium]
MDDYYPSSYADSRDRFRPSLGLLSSNWPSARLESHPLSADPNLSIDWMWAEPPRKETLVILSTGEHGIEGYVGAAMLKIFIEEFAPRLDPEATGLLLVHAINPWGMEHRRKVNENSVDPNRNFIFDGNFDPAINPDYKALDFLLTPRRPVRSFALENLSFWGRVLRALLTLGIGRVSTATLLGQYHTPDGFFYGGTKHEESATVLMDLYRRALADYEQVIQMDMHTGYGPRYQMSVIVPPVETISSAEFSRRFDYPLVQKIDASEFYAISGDMGEYIYRLREAQFPGKRLFACGFEFGTFGESLLARIRSLRAMVLENQLHWHGAVSKAAEQAVRREFEELYFPAEPRWRQKALQDGRQAFAGILRSHQLI